MPKCEWCGMTYPEGGYVYWELNLWGEELHVICDDCKKHLQKVSKKARVNQLKS